ncbi:hypothetical protein [Hornefia porci]|uniref:hypothetical protein n=1 Tax=Hornefia porci TaxID=2652292 RepID=UPI001300E5BB|nr:hypothetical protein [Hornefia porci]
MKTYGRGKETGFMEEINRMKQTEEQKKRLREITECIAQILRKEGKRNEQH